MRSQCGCQKTKDGSCKNGRFFLKIEWRKKQWTQLEGFWGGYFDCTKKKMPKSIVIVIFGTCFEMQGGGEVETGTQCSPEK